MKNREKFAKEILDIACKGNIIAVTKDNKVVCCDDIKCGQCLFYKTDDYGSHCDDETLMRWAESEYVEKKHTITLREKNFLDALLPNCKYIARDNINNNLYIYYNKPRRNSMKESWITDNSNCFYVSRDMYGNIFDFIKWEDEEPWSIEDLKNLEVRDDGKSNS